MQTIIPDQDFGMGSALSPSLGCLQIEKPLNVDAHTQQSTLPYAGQMLAHEVGWQLFTYGLPKVYGYMSDAAK